MGGGGVGAWGEGLNCDLWDFGDGGDVGDGVAGNQGNDCQPDPLHQ